MKNLAQKLVKILAGVERVKKNGLNTHQKYKYATEGDIMDAVKDSLIENNVFITESSRVLDIKEVAGKDRDGNDKRSFITTVETTHTFIDAESGETLAVTSVGQGHDSLDKGVYKAITGANKYFYMKNFMVSTGDDPENDGESKSVTSTAKDTAPVKAGFASKPVAKVTTQLATPQLKPQSIATLLTSKDAEEPDFL